MRSQKQKWGLAGWLPTWIGCLHADRLLTCGSVSNLSACVLPIRMCVHDDRVVWGCRRRVVTARSEAAARPAGPGRASSRRAERSSWRGRRAGGQASRRLEIWRSSGRGQKAGDVVGGEWAGRPRGGWRSGGAAVGAGKQLEGRAPQIRKTGDPKATGYLCVMGDLNPQPAD